MVSYNLIQNREEWNRILLTLPDPHVLQSWDWGEFKRRWGWQVERLAWRRQTGDPAKNSEEPPVAAAQILRRPIPRTPWSFLYVSKGPVWDYSDTRLTAQILTDLERYARQSRALFIKIDPDVPRAYGEPQAQLAPEAAGQATLELLAQRSWRFSPEQIQFRNTVIINLTPDPPALLERMKSKWRYNIRLAERKGVTIRPGSAADIPMFYQMYAETAARDQFLIRPPAYYHDVWQQFMQTGQAEMLLASVEEQVVGGLILFVFGPTAWYLYGASSGQHRALMPNYLLQWQAICRARARGCLSYDMWGAPDFFDDSDRMAGVYRFKSGFGGQVVQGLGAFDYPVNRALYWLFTAALPRLRARMRP